MGFRAWGATGGDLLAAKLKFLGHPPPKSDHQLALEKMAGNQPGVEAVFVRGHHGKTPRITARCDAHLGHLV